MTSQQKHKCKIRANFNRRQNVYDCVNNALSKVVHCFSVNNLLLNSNKTKCKTIRTPNTKIVKANVLLNSEPVDPVDSTVFLGITIDSK